MRVRQISPSQISPPQFAILCPGCKKEHTVDNRWTFNGDFNNPTFLPSLLTTTGCYCSQHKAGDNCWCTYNAEHPDNPSSFKCGRCHCFITNGQIQFLTDSTHALAGQTVELPEIA